MHTNSPTAIFKFLKFFAFWDIPDLLKRGEIGYWRVGMGQGKGGVEKERAEIERDVEMGVEWKDRSTHVTV